MNYTPQSPFHMTSSEVRKMEQESASVVKFNPHLGEEGEIYERCHFCSVNVPESSMEAIDGYLLCSDCYESYANTPEQEND